MQAINAIISLSEVSSCPVRVGTYGVHSPHISVAVITVVAAVDKGNSSLIQRVTCPILSNAIYIQGHSLVKIKVHIFYILFQYTLL